MKKVLNWLFGNKLSKSDKIYYLGLSIIPIFGEDNKKFDIPYKLIRYGDERVNKNPESIEEYVNFQSHWNSIMIAIMIMVFINAGLKGLISKNEYAKGYKKIHKKVLSKSPDSEKLIRFYTDEIEKLGGPFFADILSKAVFSNNISASNKKKIQQLMLDIENFFTIKVARELLK